jgi:hypothetical protein
MRMVLNEMSGYFSVSGHVVWKVIIITALVLFLALLAYVTLCLSLRKRKPALSRYILIAYHGFEDT